MAPAALCRRAMHGRLQEILCSAYILFYNDIGALYGNMIGQNLGDPEIDVTQINRLQAIQNALTRAVTKTPKHHRITPVLKTLH